MDTARTAEAAPVTPPAVPETPLDASDSSPLAQSGGRFRDDPFWDEMQDSIRRHRLEMDAEWNAPK